MQLKKAGIIGALALSSTLLLGACEVEEDKPDMKNSNTHKYDLVYYEVLNNGENSKPNVEISFDNHGKQEKIFDSLSRVNEHILKDGNQKPYVIVNKKKQEYHIYRPPYMTYGDNNFTGTVDKKEEVKK